MKKLFVIFLIFINKINAVSLQYSQGLYNLQKEKYEQAYGQLSHYLSDHPNDAELLYDIGIAAYKKGDFESASLYFEKAIEFAKDNQLREQAWFNLGNTQAYRDQLESACESYAQTLTLNPDNEDAKKNLALVQEQLKKQKEEQKNNKQKQNSDKSQEKQKNSNQKENKEEQGSQQEQEKENQSEQKNKEKNKEKEQQGQQEQKKSGEKEEEQEKSSEGSCEENPEKKSQSEEQNGQQGDKSKESGKKEKKGSQESQRQQEKQTPAQSEKKEDKASKQAEQKAEDDLTKSLSPEEQWMASFLDKVEDVQKDAQKQFIKASLTQTKERKNMQGPAW